MLRVPPCRLSARSAGTATGLTSSISGLPSKIAAKRGSTTTMIRRSGRWARRRARAGVVNTQSPRDRRRITAIRAPDGSRSNKVIMFRAITRLFFDASLIDEHHGNVVAYRIHAFALDALQAVVSKLDGGLAERTDKDFQQIFADGHNKLPSLVQNTRANGAWDFFQLSFDYEGLRGLIRFNIDHNVSDLRIGLQILARDVDVLFGENAV